MEDPAHEIQPVAPESDDPPALPGPPTADALEMITSALRQSAAPQPPVTDDAEADDESDDAPSSEATPPRSAQDTAPTDGDGAPRPSRRSQAAAKREAEFQAKIDAAIAEREAARQAAEEASARERMRAEQEARLYQELEQFVLSPEAYDRLRREIDEAQAGVARLAESVYDADLDHVRDAGRKLSDLKARKEAADRNREMAMVIAARNWASMAGDLAPLADDLAGEHRDAYLKVRDPAAAVRAYGRGVAAAEAAKLVAQHQAEVAALKGRVAALEAELGTARAKAVVPQPMVSGGRPGSARPIVDPRAVSADELIRGAFAAAARRGGR